METTLLLPPSTVKALLPIYDIVKPAINFVICNDYSYRFVDRNNHNLFTIAQISFQEIVEIKTA